MFDLVPLGVPLGLEVAGLQVVGMEVADREVAGLEVADREVAGLELGEEKPQRAAVGHRRLTHQRAGCKSIGDQSYPELLPNLLAYHRGDACRSERLCQGVDQGESNRSRVRQRRQ